MEKIKITKKKKMKEVKGTDCGVKGHEDRKMRRERCH